MFEQLDDAVAAVRVAVTVADPDGWDQARAVRVLAAGEEIERLAGAAGLSKVTLDSTSEPNHDDPEAPRSPSLRSHPDLGRQ